MWGMVNNLGAKSQILLFASYAIIIIYIIDFSNAVLALITPYSETSRSCYQLPSQIFNKYFSFLKWNKHS